MQIKSRDVGFAYVCSLLRGSGFQTVGTMFPSLGVESKSMREQNRDRGSWSFPTGGEKYWNQTKFSAFVLEALYSRLYSRFNEYIKSTCKLFGRLKICENCAELKVNAILKYTNFRRFIVRYSNVNTDLPDVIEM